VEFEEHHNPRVADERWAVEITSYAGRQMVRVVATAQDDLAALDLAVDKFERRLRKLKERLIQRTRTRDHKQLDAGLPPSDEERDGAPQIVRTKRFAMHPMTPEEAALQMEMIGHDFFFFLDAGSGRHSVLYHRKDGQLGLIEPS
jgi:putative sigma-54 modulation protein